MTPCEYVELFKHVMISAIQVLHLQKHNIQQAIQSVQPSRNTQWIGTIANYVSERVTNNLNRCKLSSVATDESTDIMMVLS